MDIQKNPIKSIRHSVSLLRKQVSGSLAVSLLQSAGMQVVVGLAALLLARVEFSSGIYPFGLALVIGVPDRFSIAALMGFVINNWVGDTIVGANSAYIGAVGVVAALRWILAGMAKDRYKKDNYLPCLVAGLLSVVITELIVLALTGTFSLASISRLTGGVALSGAFSYFYHISFESFKRRRSIFELSSTQKASLALMLCTLLMALYPIALGPFSLGRLCGVALVIFGSYLLSAPLDAAILAAVSAAIALCEPSFLFAGVGMSVGGVLSSLFKKRGKGMMGLVYILSTSLFAVCAQNYVYSLTYISEVLFGSLLFLILPLRVPGNARFEHLSETLTSATSAIGVKLSSISSAMRDITTLLDRTVPAQDARHVIDELYNETIDCVCRRCPQATVCWVENYTDSVDALNKLTPTLCAQGAIGRENFSAHFLARCINAPALAKEINLRYAGRIETAARDKNTQLYKETLKKQFMAVSDMLDTAKEELCALREWDESKSKRIYDCAVRLGLPVMTAGCIYDHDGHPVVTVSLRDLPPESMIKRLTAGISMIAGATLGKPSIEDSDGATVLCFAEQPAYNISTATAQLAAEGKTCGDVYSVFTDLKGNVHMLLSDGMGTGAAAARDGATCCAFLRRLLESGFSIKRAAELANAALSMREDAEMASTLDALSFNVFKGGARLFKAGASATYCLRGTRVIKIDGQTLPVGILDRVVCKEFQLPVSDGDIVVMTSDGVADEGCRFIEEALKTAFSASAEDICREIVRRIDSIEGQHDDVTVMVAKISLHNEE